MRPLTFTLTLCWGLALMIASILPAHAQMANYTRTSTLSAISNFTSGCSTQNCWHTMPAVSGAATLTATNHHVVVLDSSGCAWLYSDYPSNSYTEQSGWGCGLLSVVFDGGGTFWSLQASSSCTNGTSLIYYWSTRSGGWVSADVCSKQISTAQDGSSYYLSLGGAGYIWTSTNGTNYTQLSTTSTYLAVSALSTNVFFAIKSDGTVWNYNAGTWTQLASLGHSATQIANDLGGDVYVIAGGVVYHCALGCSAWDTVSGSNMTSIGDMGAVDVYATNSSGTILRFSETGIVHTRSVVGSAESCPTGCNGVTHTVTVQACWGSKCGIQQQQQYSPPTEQANVQATAVLFDLFDCFEGDSDCTPEVADSVYCSYEAENLINDVGPVQPDAQFVWSYTAGRITGPPQYNNPGYTYPIANYCTAGSSQTVAALVGGNTSTLLDDFFPDDVDVELKTSCFRIGTSPWACGISGEEWLGSNVWARYNGPQFSCYNTPQ